MSGDRTYEGRAYMGEMEPVAAGHPIDWLRGKRLIGVAIKDLEGFRLGSRVTLTIHDDEPEMFPEGTAS